MREKSSVIQEQLRSPKICGGGGCHARRERNELDVYVPIRPKEAVYRESPLQKCILALLYWEGFVECEENRQWFKSSFPHQTHMVREIAMHKNNKTDRISTYPVNHPVNLTVRGIVTA